MKRYTVQGKDGGYTIPPEYMDEAVQRLARFENMVLAIEADQEKTIKKLAALRDEGKQKTVKSRELLAQKLYNSNMLSMLKVYGLE